MRQATISSKAVAALRIPAVVLAGLLLVQGPAATGQPQGNRSSSREIQRQYQQMNEELQLLIAKINQRQYEFGKEGLEQTKEIIEELVGIVKYTPPGEDVPENSWFEFAAKLGSLVHWTCKTGDDIVDSQVDLAEGEAKLGGLQQRLAEDKVRVETEVQALRAIDNATRNPDLTLQPLPARQEPDWSPLDQAIEDMRKEDQTILEAEDQQLQNAPAHPDIVDPSENLPQIRQTLQDLQQQLNSSSQDLQQAQNQLQFQQQQDQAAQNSGPGMSLQIAIPVPPGWVPCTCPDQHPGAGIFVNGVQYHTPLLHCQ